MVAQAPSKPLFGHPPGLFELFFVEMWERFSYYGMRALLLLYMMWGFLHKNDSDAYGIYAAYTALVYATPFIGGMLADRILGARRAIVLGGLLMAGGHLLMTIEQEAYFFGGLALLIVGNGFFKPNISTVVGALYDGESDTKRAGGFNIFYMGINLGAAMSPILCGYVGETYGWHYGFGLATIGMLMGLITFVLPDKLSRFLILLSAAAVAVSLLFMSDNQYLFIVNIAIALALLAAGIIAFKALGRGVLPTSIGQVPSLERLKGLALPKLSHKRLSYLGMVAGSSVLAFLGLYFGEAHEIWFYLAVSFVLYLFLLPYLKMEPALYLGVALSVFFVSVILLEYQVAQDFVYVVGALAFGLVLFQAFRMPKIPRHRLFVALILMFFAMLFFAFFEQAGSSVNNFTDRNVNRIVHKEIVTEEHLGETRTIELTQSQLGWPINGEIFLMADLKAMKEQAQKAWVLEGVNPGPPTATITLTEAHLGMGISKASDEIPTSMFQAANPIYILIFALVFTALWKFLARRGLEPSVPVKFGFGLVQLALGFLAFYWGAKTAGSDGMAFMGWLLLGYLLQTTGEICLSPVGLSIMIKLSPKHMVSSIMGAWFLATAYSQLVGGEIAKFTSVDGVEEGILPTPANTVAIYGDVFLMVAASAGVAALVLFALSPLLNKWMHMEAPFESEA